MEAKRCQYSASIGNFELNVVLLNGTKMKVEMVSLLDGRLYSLEVTDETLEKSIKEFFSNVSNVYAVLEDQIKGRKDVVATDLGNIKFSIVIYKVGDKEIKKDFVLDLKEVEMDKFERLERVVKKIGLRYDQNSGTVGYTRLEFEPDKAATPFPNILQETDVFSNKANGTWISLFGKNAIPEKGQYYFELQLVKWANRQLMFGIGSANLKTTNSSYGQADSICLFLQNNNTSSLYDRGANTRVGSFGTFEEGDRIICKINRDTSIISWCFFNETIAWTRITKDLKAKPLFIKVEFLYSSQKIKIV